MRLSQRSVLRVAPPPGPRLCREKAGQEEEDGEEEEEEEEEGGEEEVESLGWHWEVLG